jgi:polyhydroxyalkanoate synthase
LHADFLDLYARNPLPDAGQAKALGRSIDLKKVSSPSYVVAGITDHIVPWKAGYRATQMLGGQSEFVLSSSGHIQSIVNPPGNPKASFHAGPAIIADPDEWLRDALQTKGSWWEHWARWVSRHSGARRPAPSALGSRKHRVRGATPGKYVLEK